MNNPTPKNPRDALAQWLHDDPDYARCWLDGLKKMMTDAGVRPDVARDHAEEYMLRTFDLPGSTFFTRRKMTPGEAVYLLMGELTAREEPVTFSTRHDAAPGAEIARKFIRRHGLFPPPDDFGSSRLVYIPDHVYPEDDHGK